MWEIAYTMHVHIAPTMKLDIRNSGQWSLIIDYLEGWNS